MSSQEELGGDLHLHLTVREPEDGEVLGLAAPVGHTLLFAVVRCGQRVEVTPRAQQHPRAELVLLMLWWGWGSSGVDK